MILIFVIIKIWEGHDLDIYNYKDIFLIFGMISRPLKVVHLKSYVLNLLLMWLILGPLRDLVKISGNYSLGLDKFSSAISSFHLFSYENEW